jgi:DNA-binding MarR family transcriptional regulator
MSLADPRTAHDLLNYRLSRLLASSGAMVVRLCEGRYGITRREWRLIALLAEEGAMSPSQLAESAHLERARVSALITDLTAKKLVRRVAVPGDARRAVVKLSEEGKALYDELLPISVRFQQEVLAALSPAEREMFDVALGKLTDAAERIAASKPVAEKADRQHGGGRRLRAR